MKTETIETAASIVAPIGNSYFRGSLAEATDAMVAYAAELRADYGGGATSDLIKRLRHSDPDRVAEIAAVALLNLAEQTKPAPDRSQPTPPFPLTDSEAVLLDGRPATVYALPDPESDPTQSDYLWTFAVDMGTWNDLTSLTQEEVAARVRKP